MKKIKLFLMMASMAGTFQACTSKKATNHMDSTSITTTDITKTAAPADTTKAAATTTTADSADVKFVNKAAVSGMAEVALGKLALQKTNNTQIKDFAQMMVTDHGKANDELMNIAKSKNITLPTAPDAEHQQKMDDLSKKTGVDFDKAYVNAMIDGHKAALSLMRNEAKNGKDADLKKFAGKTAIIVQMHSELIARIHAKQG